MPHEDLRRDRYCYFMATTTKVSPRPTHEFSPKHMGPQICKSFLVQGTGFVMTREQSQFCSDGSIDNDQTCLSSF
jgi:hypothetical protein